MAIYLPMPNPPKELKLEAVYLDYRTPKGLYVQLTVVERSKTPGGFNAEAFVTSDRGNYNVLALEMKRRNQKQLELLNLFLQGVAADVAEAYQQGERERVEQIIGEFSA